MTRKNLLTIFLTVTILLFSFSVRLKPEPTVTAIHPDLDGIIERGRLIAVTDASITSYFLYRGEPMGFNFELLKAFAAHLGVDLEVRVASDAPAAIDMLTAGYADIVAISMPDPERLSYRYALTTAIYSTRDVLVQRRPEGWRRMGREEMRLQLVRSFEGLAGSNIYLPGRSLYNGSVDPILERMKDEVGVIMLPADAETVISMVASGEIPYTIVDESHAAVASILYSDLDVSLPISLPRPRSWAVRFENSEELLSAFNSWFELYSKTRDYAILYSNYYRNQRSLLIYRSAWYANNTGRISPWDELLIRYSDSISWDWRLVASLVAQESRFNPHVTSRAGAYGLMQVMPATAEFLGIDIKASPEQNVKAGVKYLAHLESMFIDIVPDEVERKRFVLAAYNAGPGHVFDAIRLAGAEGADTTIWHGSVEQYLLKKSNPDYYRRADVRHGFLRGRETVRYVTDVMYRYENYRNLID